MNLARWPEDAAGISKDGAPVGVATLTAPVPAAVRYDDNVHNHQQRLVNDSPLQVVTGRQVPQHARHQLLHVVVRRLAEEANEGVGAAGRLDGPLIFIVLSAVRKIPAQQKQITGWEPSEFYIKNKQSWASDNTAATTWSCLQAKNSWLLHYVYIRFS